MQISVPTFIRFTVAYGFTDLGQGVKQQDCLAPGCVDFIPLHTDIIGAPQPKPPDGAKRAIMPDAEDILVHVCLLQTLQVGCCVLHLHVTGLSRGQCHMLTVILSSSKAQMDYQTCKLALV